MLDTCNVVPIAPAPRSTPTSRTRAGHSGTPAFGIETRSRDEPPSAIFVNLAVCTVFLDFRFPRSRREGTACTSVVKQIHAMTKELTRRQGYQFEGNAVNSV